MLFLKDYSDLYVHEQKTDGISIVCQVYFGHGTMNRTYFVCDSERNITQYFSNMIADQRFLKRLRELGYKFNGK